MIRYIKRKEIDAQKWDACIEKSLNALVYGYSWYLDCVAENWDALVEDDYSSVFPLPWKQKYGIKYIYQPFFCQQLGVFSRRAINQDLLNQFIKAVPLKFCLIDLNINGANIFETKPLKAKKNYLLKLNESYDALFENYEQNNKKNIVKARKNGLSLTKKITNEDLITHFKGAYGKFYRQIRESDYDRLMRLIAVGQSLKKVRLTGVIDKDGNLCASALFIHANKRYHYLFGAPTEKGRESRAIYFLLDEFIKEKSNSDQILDFEGSEIPNVEYFYKNFGAAPEYYFNLRVNRLKFWER
jgi:hypothetical protein